jgi:hypothetical protein
MRKLTIAAATVALTLMAAGAALAFTQASNIFLTATKAGQSTGIKADLHSVSDPGAAPKAAKQIRIQFPAGTKFNLGRVKACTLSDKQLQAGKSCPAASGIGAGSATASLFPLPQPVLAGVKAFAAGANKMVLVVKATSPAPATLVIHETITGTTLNIPVPTPTVAGFKVVLVSLKLNVPSKRIGKTPLITAGKCTAGKFPVRAHFLYADGSTLDITSSSTCK